MRIILTFLGVQGAPSARLRYGDEVIEITTVSMNEIVLEYKILYFEIITIMKRIESNMEKIKSEEPSQATAKLLDVRTVTCLCILLVYVVKGSVLSHRYSVV